MLFCKLLHIAAEKLRNDEPHLEEQAFPKEFPLGQGGSDSPRENLGDAEYYKNRCSFLFAVVSFQSAHATCAR